MDADERTVVVICPVARAYNRRGELHAARFAALGLTSFGDTPTQAEQRLKKLFKTFIHTHRELGVLEQTLNELGVEWYWEDEYPADKPPYENMNEFSNEFSNSAGLQQALEASGAQLWQGPDGNTPAPEEMHLVAA